MPVLTQTSGVVWRNTKLELTTGSIAHVIHRRCVGLSSQLPLHIKLCGFNLAQSHSHSRSNPVHIRMSTPRTFTRQNQSQSHSHSHFHLNPTQIFLTSFQLSFLRSPDHLNADPKQTPVPPVSRCRVRPHQLRRRSRHWNEPRHPQGAPLPVLHPPIEYLVRCFHGLFGREDRSRSFQKWCKGNL